MVTFKIGDFRRAYHKAKLALGDKFKECKLGMIINTDDCMIIANSSDYKYYFHQSIKVVDHSLSLKVSIELTDEIVDFFNSESGFNYSIQIDKIKDVISFDICYLGKSLFLEYKEYQYKNICFNSRDEFYGIVSNKRLLKPINKAIDKILSMIDNLDISYKFRDNKYYFKFKDIDIELSLHLEISMQSKEIYFEFVYTIKILCEYDFNEFYENNMLFNCLTGKKSDSTIEYNSYEDKFILINKVKLDCLPFSFNYNLVENKIYLPYNVLTMLTIKSFIDSHFRYIIMLSEENQIKIYHYSGQFAFLSPNIEL